jgi:hypothetical protein
MPHTLYVIAHMVIALAQYDSLDACLIAEQRLLSNVWYDDFRTACIADRGIPLFISTT